MTSETLDQWWAGLDDDEQDALMATAGSIVDAAKEDTEQLLYQAHLTYTKLTGSFQMTLFDVEEVPA